MSGLAYIFRNGMSKQSWKITSSNMYSHWSAITMSRTTVSENTTSGTSMFYVLNVVEIVYHVYVTIICGLESIYSTVPSGSNLQGWGQPAA